MNQKVVPLVAVLFSLVNYGFAGTAETAASNVTVTSGDTLEIKWTVIPTTGESVHSLDLLVLPNTTWKIFSGVLPAIQPLAITLFGVDRLSATFVGSTYTLMLKNVSYADSVTFQLFAVFVNGAGDKFDPKRSDIQVTVNGSAIFCDINLEYHHTVNESEVLTVEPKVCGYPIPKLEWKVGDDAFNTSYNSFEINTKIRLYKYSFKTRPITRKDCGRNLTLVTSNTIGSMERNAQIDVKFVPSRVPDVLFCCHIASCVRVTWKREDTGKCVFNYHLQFAGEETIRNTSNTYFTLCNATDVKNVTIWASYNGAEGEKVTYNISTTTPPPSTTTTTTATTTTTSKTSITTSITTSSTTNGTVIKNDDKSNIGLIVGIVGGILFVIIIIIIVVCVLKHKKKNGTGNHSGYAMRVTGEENNYVTDPTRSNGRQPANPDDPEQAIYSELGPGGGRTGPRPAPEQSDYAEMKVDAMGYPIDGAKASEPPTYAPVIKPREGAKRRTPSPPRSNVDGARVAASAEPPAYAPIIKNRSSSRGRSPPPDEDDHEGVIV